jgi:release factor glutamine methyltransferase
MDICTGSGCIALAIAANSHARVLAVDISDGALDIAQKNIEKHALSGRVRTEKHNALSVEFASKRDKFDIIVSNPPYIPSADIENLSPEVKSEPLLALDGGADGLIFYKRFIEILPTMLKSGGAIVFEIGYDQEKGIRALCEKAALSCDIFKDYGGNVRGAVIKPRLI